MFHRVNIYPTQKIYIEISDYANLLLMPNTGIHMGTDFLKSAMSVAAFTVHPNEAQSGWAGPFQDQGS